jgi:muconolactone delta-isomerase
MEMKEYMINIALPLEWTQEFVMKIQLQRQHINKLFDTGKLLSYSLSEDRSKLWVILIALNENDLLNMLSQFPLIDYMDVEYTELMFHNTSANMFPPLIYN